MPFGRKHDDHDQQQADPEIPVLRIDAGELVARDHEDDGADEAAIERAGAAEDQHHQHVGGALEAEDFQRDGLGRLRQQRAGDAGDRGRRWCRSCGYGLGSARRSPACAPDSRGCRAATARTANGSAAARPGRPGTGRRANRHRRCSRRDRTRTCRRAATSCTPCRPSAPPVSQCALLAASCSSRPRPSVIMISARWRKRAMMKLVSIADQAGDRRRDQQARERLAPAGLGDEPGGIGAEAEERGMAERDDAGIAEDQIEREREQRRDGDLARERQIGSGTGRTAASVASQNTNSIGCQRDLRFKIADAGRKPRGR